MSLSLPYFSISHITSTKTFSKRGKINLFRSLQGKQTLQNTGFKPQLFVEYYKLTLVSQTGRVLYCTLVPLEQGKNTLWWPMKNRLMSGWMVQLKTALSDCHKICETLYSPLLFIGRTRTATFTLETLRLLSSMVPPDLWQMNEWIQVKPVIRSIHLTTKPRIRLNLGLFPRIAPEHIILFLHRSFIAWDTSLFR